MYTGTKTIEVTAQQAKNLQAALEMLFAKCTDNLQAVPPFSEGAPAQVQYFKDKRVEIYEQIQTINNLLK